MVDGKQKLFGGSKGVEPGRYPTDPYDWAACLHSGNLPLDEYEAYLTWSDKNPKGKAIVESLESTWELVGSIPYDLRLPLGSAAKQPRPSRRFRFAADLQRLMFGSRLFGTAMASAFLLVLIVFAAHLFQSIPDKNLYETQRAELRVINLFDGSVVYLSAKSRIRVAYTPLERRLYLEQGEAFFVVVHYILKPFKVVVDDGEIRALGTKFNVKRHPEGGTMVTLLAGKVQVRAIGGLAHNMVEILEIPGARAALLPSKVETSEKNQSGHTGKAPIRLASVDAANVAPWREGKLVFDGVPLVEALKEINHHANHDIRIDDAKIGQMPVYGVFNTGDWQGALSAFVKSYPVYAEQVSAFETRLIAVDST